jgi:predicted nucleic acid-binding Zn ribbon protein
MVSRGIPERCDEYLTINRKSRRAFSLVELPVVIASIATLIIMLGR